MDIGKRTTRLRKVAGITTNRLASLCGLSQRLYSSNSAPLRLG